MLKVKLTGYHNNFAETNPELYLQMKEISEYEMPELEKAKVDKWWRFEAHVNNIEDLPDEMHKNLEFEVIRPLRSWAKKHDAYDIKVALQTSQVHLPGNELLKLKMVKVQTDCCTDALQKELEEGWKIITVCIQPDQRRPDYVLGREF